MNDKFFNWLTLTYGMSEENWKYLHKDIQENMLKRFSIENLKDTPLKAPTPPPEKPAVKIGEEYYSLDAAVEKANRLVELLREAKQIIDSLSKSEVLMGEKEKWDNCLHCGRGLYQECPNPDCKIGPKRKPFQNPVD